MQKLRDASLEIILIILVGGLIGATLAVVSNLFVIGVQWFELQRQASSLFAFNIGDQSLSFSSVIYLWLAAAIVVALKNRL